MVEIAQSKISNLKLLKINERVGACLRNTVVADKIQASSAAFVEIFKVLRPGEPTTPEASKVAFEDLFFDKDKYSLSEVGRVKLNARLELDIDEKCTTLTKEDIIEIVRTLVNLKEGFGSVDDIDNLGNRRI